MSKTFWNSHNQTSLTKATSKFKVNGSCYGTKVLLVQKKNPSLWQTLLWCNLLMVFFSLSLLLFFLVSKNVWVTFPNLRKGSSDLQIAWKMSNYLKVSLEVFRWTSTTFKVTCLWMIISNVQVSLHQIHTSSL